MSDRTMSHGLTQGIYIVVHNRTAPSREEWQAYVDAMERQVKLIRGVLVYTDGGGPDAVGRQYVAAMWKRQGQNPPIVIMTPKVMLRAGVIALNWFLSKPMEMYAPEDLSSAASSLQLSASEREEVREALVERLRAMRMTVPAGWT